MMHLTRDGFSGRALDGSGQRPDRQWFHVTGTPPSIVWITNPRARDGGAHPSTIDLATRSRGAVGPAVAVE